MSWKVRQTRRFARAYKKLHDNVAADVDGKGEGSVLNGDPIFCTNGNLPIY
jgi:hypothetical protein